MSRAEVDLAVEWAAQEGWNPGLYDADCFYATDPNGFLVGTLDGTPIGCISAVAYDITFGFLGFYIVRPEYRGRGYGIALWRAAIDYLGDRQVGLDGVVAQQANYAKSGFRLVYRNIRCEGIARNLPRSPEVIELGGPPSATLLDYDAAHFPVPRAEFLRCWTTMPESTTLGITDGDQLAGYGVIRRCRRGHKIGPLFARSPSHAETLFQALSSQVPPGEPIFLDVPEPNDAAVSLAERHAMRRVFETARMYRGQAPDVPLDEIFGVTTFELG